MTRLSMNEITTFRWSLEEDLRNYQQAGYRSIGIWRQKLADFGEPQAVERLAESGLRVSNMLWAGGFTGSDGRSFEESIEDAEDALRLAAEIQAGCLVLYPGGRNNHTFRHADRLLRTALEELLPLAQVLEVPLAIEPMHAACAKEWTFLTDLETVIELLDEFQSPWLKIAYDTYHFPLVRDQHSLLVELVPHLGIVTLGDRHRPPCPDHERCPLGRGDLPLEAIVGSLLEAGYAGDFDIKLMGQEIESRCYWNLLEQSQKVFSELFHAHQASSTVAKSVT